MNLELLIHFMKFNIQSHTLEFKEWIDQLYVSNDLTASYPENASTLNLFIEDKDTPAAALIDQPTRDRVFAETNLCNGRCYYENGKFFSANYGDYWHEMVYNLEQHRIYINVGGMFLVDGQAIISRVVRPILQSFILPFYKIKSLHGAVLTRGGKTVFLSGRGGAGKTTTALSLMREGYHLLSEDGPLFFTAHNRANVLSSLDYLHVTEKTVELFPHLKSQVVGKKDHREKYSVRMSDVQNDCALSAPDQVTHFIRINRGSVSVPKISRLPRNEAHRILIDESMIVFRKPIFRTKPFSDYSEFVFELITKVVSGSETYELEFADHHLAELPALLERL